MQISSYQQGCWSKHHSSLHNENELLQAPASQSYHNSPYSCPKINLSVTSTPILTTSLPSSPLSSTANPLSTSSFNIIPQLSQLCVPNNTPIRTGPLVF